MIHTLKTNNLPFSAVWENLKFHELRNNDRKFQVNDYLVLREYDNFNYSGREIFVKITYITKNCYGLPRNLCILSFKKLAQGDLNQIQQYITENNLK